MVAGLGSIGIDQYFNAWLTLVLMPLSHFSLLWRMLPVYINGLLASIYLKPSNTAAVFGGITALWAGADWVKTYMLGQGVVAVSYINWVIAGAFIIYGVLSSIVGFGKMKSFYFLFGRRSILTYFAVSVYPIQVGRIEATQPILTSILLLAVPVILAIEIFAMFAREILD